MIDYPAKTPSADGYAMVDPNKLMLLTPAEDESKLNTLISKLVKFKNLWDRDAALGAAHVRSSGVRKL